MNRARRARPAAPRILAVAILVLSAAPGSAQLVWDRSAVSLYSEEPISGIPQYTPFSVPHTVFGLTATVWINDTAVNDNGVLDSFSGALGWGVFEDAAGSLGDLVADGVDASPVAWDTGFQAFVLSDQVRLVIELDGLPALPPGDYWLGLRETAPGAPNDGSAVHWARNSDGSGDFAATVLAGRATRDQSDFDAAGSNSNISAYLTANDFVLTTTTRLSSLAVWLVDDVSNDNGVLDSFDGTLSWALLADAAGPSPGSLLDFGTDTSPRIFPESDQNAGKDIARVEIELRDPITLTPGFYWLALHEGAWGSGFDGDEVWWIDAVTRLDIGLFLDSTVSSPGPWSPIEEFDSAFVLFQSLLFASGFEDDVTCAWTVASGGATCP